MTGNYSILTVTARAPSIDLTTLANLKTDLDIDSSIQDTYLSRQITQASSAIANYCNRVFPVQGYSETQRPQRDPRPYFLPNNRNPIILKNAPIVQVASVTEGGEPLLEGEDFELDENGGWLYRLDQNGQRAWWPSWPIVVAYSAGWLLPGQEDTAPPSGAEPLPPNLEHAVIRLISSALYARKRDPLLRQEDVAGIGSRVYWVGGVGQTASNFPPDVQDLVDNYRLPAFA